jgi:hypothetical protein
MLGGWAEVVKRASESTSADGSRRSRPCRYRYDSNGRVGRHPVSRSLPHFPFGPRGSTVSGTFHREVGVGSFNSSNRLSPLSV